MGKIGQNREQKGDKKTKDGKHLVHLLTHPFTDPSSHVSTRRHELFQVPGLLNTCRSHRKGSWFHQAYLLTGEAENRIAG